MKVMLVCLLMFLVVGVGCGGDNGQKATNDVDPDSVDPLELPIAYVGDIPITGFDLRSHMLQRSGPERVDEYIRQPDVLQVALGALMDQIVWSLVAKEQGYALTPSEKARVLALESELLATRYMGDVIQEKARPPKEQVEQFYNDNQERYLAPTRVGVRHILLDTEAEAQRLRAELEGGADFAALARTRSKDTNTRDIGGALGFVQKGKEILGIGKNGVFERAVLVLDPGQLTVVKTDKGWHVVRAEKKEGGGLIPLAEVYDGISDALLSENFGRVYNEELQKAREKHEAKFDAENIERLTGTKENTRRLMQIAGEQKETRGKIEVYRRISYDFPDTREAPEATFMVAYLNFVENKDRKATEQALNRLRRKFGKTKWGKAGAYLQEHLDDDPEIIPTPSEILKQTR